MKCPNCGHETATGASACPHCGVIFAKLRARKELPEASALAAIAADAASPQLGARWLIICLVCLALTSFIGYSRSNIQVTPYSETVRQEPFSPPAPGTVAYITDPLFENGVLKSQLPVMVEFAAEDCQVCQKMKPAIAMLARDLQGRCLVAIIDSRTGLNSFRRYQIRGTPYFLLFNKGGEISRVPGVPSTDPEEARKIIGEWVNQALKGQ